MHTRLAGGRAALNAGALDLSLTSSIDQQSHIPGFVGYALATKVPSPNSAGVGAGKR